MNDDTPARISVSRDAMRADMAELELRLQSFIRAELAAKADKSDLVALAARLAVLESQREARDQGILTNAQNAAIDARIVAIDAQAADRAWSWKERSLAVLSGLVTVATLVLSLLLARGGVH